MKTSKSLTSAVVAAALVGAIGLAYAQTQMPTPPVDSSTPMANQPATGTMSASSTDTSMQTERPMQADRN